MFTLDQIRKISKQEFNNLSDDNKKLILTILEEYRDHGRSETLLDIWKADYDEKRPWPQEK